MIRHNVISNLLNRILEKKLSDLELNFTKHKHIIDQCNVVVIAILQDKTLKELTFEKDKVSAVNIGKDNSIGTYKVNSNKVLEIKAKNDKKNSLKTDKSNEKIEKKYILKTEKSVRDTSHKDKPNELNYLRRSYTKANALVNKEIVKNINEKKLVTNSYVKSKLTLIKKKENLNKTFFQQSTLKNKHLSPEKKNTDEFNQKNQCNNKHNKTGSTISTEGISRQISLTSPKFLIKKTASKTTHPEILPQKEKDYISIQDQLINTPDVFTTQEKIIQIEKKIEQMAIQKDFEELLKTHMNIISSFITKNDILKLNLNKKLNKIIIRNFITRKKDEMIQNEKNLKILREKYSMDDLMKEPDQFKMSASSIQSIEKLDSSSALFNDSSLPDERIIFLFRAYFQLVNVKIRFNSNSDFWMECCNYFKDKNIHLSEASILKLSNILSGNENFLSSDLFKSNDLLESMSLLIKDIYEHSGLKEDNLNNACILFSFYRFKFEEINRIIDKLRKIENSIKK